MFKWNALCIEPEKRRDLARKHLYHHVLVAYAGILKVKKFPGNVKGIFFNVTLHLRTIPFRNVLLG